MNPDVRTAVHDRADGRCEAAAVEACWRRGNQAHHILRRSQGGQDTESNLLWVCSPCHIYIHGNPNVANLNGWLRRMGNG